MNYAERFKEFVEEGTNNEYLLDSPYVTSKQKVTIYHTVCGNDWEVTPNNFKNGNRCIHCSGRRPITYEEVREYMSINPVYAMYDLNECINGSDITITHRGCGRRYKTSWTSLRANKRCMTCYGNHRKDHNTFESEVLEVLGEDYKVVSEYTGRHDKVTMYHSTCSTTYEAVPGSILKGHGCRKCAGMEPYTSSSLQEVIDGMGEPYKVLGEVRGSLEKVLMRHTECGTEYMVRPNLFLRGSRCPECCFKSRGEEKTQRILTKNHIPYRREVTFPDCVHKNRLPFDFGVLDTAGDILFLIEYDGIQHFKAVQFFGGDSHLEAVQVNDRIKTEYCQINNIPLLRIPYDRSSNMENDILDLYKQLKHNKDGN